MWRSADNHLVTGSEPLQLSLPGPINLTMPRPATLDSGFQIALYRKDQPTSEVTHMFEGFTRAQIDTSSARIALRHGGDGPPLLLLHGNPLTHVSWHGIANRLARHFHVVCPDLRGYGDSVGPEDGGENHVNYSFRAMALDQVEVMQQLGYREFMVAGHDRGARTTARMCLDHRDRIQRAAVVDILPNYHVWTHTSKHWATKSWHWLFMIQPYDMPERMMAGVPAAYYMEKKLSKTGIGLGFFHPDAFAEYVRCFTWKTIRGSCEDYRACASCDFEMDEADYNAGHRIECPLFVIWGARSHTGTVHGDVLAVWRDYATNATGGSIDCGHYVQEEAPDATFDAFIRHFKT
jgi:haloacetate dehalogenase